jgi:IMP dehydrogenase
MEKEITFSDILLRPKYSEVTSRSNVDLTCDMDKLKIRLPVISANMRHITGPKMATEMLRNGGFGILHRFNTTEEAIREFQEVYKSAVLPGNPNQSYCCGVSVGVQDKDQERFEALFTAGARIFCIDVAHGHHILVKNMIKSIKGDDIIIIAGNIATPEAAFDLTEWGADILKIGIGPGSVCMTRKNTGVGVPQFTALKEISEVAKVPIIADGGIKSVGDIAKALLFADAVMVGSFIAGSSETPGKVYRNEEDQFYKVYGGSASGENKVSHGKANEFVEGVMQTVSFKGHVKHILREIKCGLQSSLSYVGANNLTEFRAKAEWRIISNGSQRESKI